MVYSILNWLKLRRFQYNVTLPMFMLTPTERFFFNIFLLTLLVMIFTAAFIYFPQHLIKVAQRATFYFSGHDQLVATNGASNVDAARLSLSSAAAAATGAAKQEL